MNNNVYNAVVEAEPHYSVAKTELCWSTAIIMAVKHRDLVEASIQNVSHIIVMEIQSDGPSFYRQKNPQFNKR